MDQGLTVADFERPANFLPGAQQPSLSQLLAHLPETARPKLERFADVRENAHAIVRDASRNLEELRDARRLQENSLRIRLSEQKRTLTDEDRERLNAPVERARAEEKRAQARYDAAVEAWSRSNFVERTTEWLTQARRDRVRLRSAKVPVVKVSDDHRVAVDRIRVELAGLDEAWAAAQAAPLPIAIARENLSREIDAIAALGAPEVDLRRRSSAPIPVEKIFRPPHTGEGQVLVGNYGVSFLVWFLRDELKVKLAAMLGDRDPEGALTDERRDRCFGEIAAKRLELERLEEAHILAAEAVGQAIFRREDADLRAILEVDD